MATTDRIRLGIALDGAGHHPAAWREPSSRPGDLFTAGYWVDTVQQAERAGFDFATIDDSLALQSSELTGPDDRTDEVRGRLDALLIAARVAPVTATIGLIPAVVTTHTEPFHVSKAVATLDFVSNGRAGWQPRVSLRTDEWAHIGRREYPFADGFEAASAQEAIDELFAEGRDAVEVVRALWDSWEDDAEIRDVATDRFLDRDKVHTIDFVSERFSVRGPSITPRSPQGQPVIATLAHVASAYRFAAQTADLVFVTPSDRAQAESTLRDVRDAERATGRSGEPLQVFADLVVFLDGDERATDRRARLDALGRPLTSDARIFAGSATDLADEIEALQAVGYAGVRIRPGVTTDDLPLIAETLQPELERRGLLAPASAGSLRARLGLATEVPNRFASAIAG